MKINTKELLKALEIVKPGLASKEMIEQSTSFAFMNDKVVTYNDEISISCPVKGLGITGAIHAQKLYQFFSKLKKDEVDVEITDNEILFKSGRQRAGFTLESEIKLPLEEIDGLDEWKDLPEGFIEALQFTHPCCSTDMSRPILTAVHINKTIVEASDAFRLAVFTLDSPVPTDKLLIPAGSIRELVKLKPVQITTGTGWVHFKTKEGAVISCRRFEDPFPSVKHLLTVDGTQLRLPKTITEIVEKATIFSTDGDEFITITLVDNKMIIKGKSESGWFEEEANIKYDGEEANFFVNPHFLQTILTKSNRCIIAPDKIKFEGESWEYIAMLRVK